MAWRQQGRMSFGSAPAASVAVQSVTTIGNIVTANGFPPAWNIRADLNYALGPGGGVASIDDLSGNLRHFTEVVSSQQPLWLPSDANGYPAFQGDGVDDRLTNSWSHAAVTAGTASTHVWVILVAAQDTWTANDTLWSDGGLTIYQNTTSSGLRQYGGTGNGPQNNNWTGYKRIVANFTGSSSSYLWVGSVLVNGTSIGAGASVTNSVLLAAPGGVRFLNGRIAEAAAGFGDISPGAVAAVDAYCSARYGASVLA